MLKMSLSPEGFPKDEFIPTFENAKVEPITTKRMPKMNCITLGNDHDKMHYHRCDTQNEL